ncbi:FkbM family methyltransferase [Mesorhizobium sp. B292B1B]|uniref:FkbM family methyltransferase n=1 Tax=unclassified Mesorhizobium TaxID=325217 RepID=UPI00112BCAB5|nr:MULTISPECIES: FkbM family methyltransferase [unclassified Mesorhizobium]MCA0012521.1 FkbM family methyltransferase [Mesorhizobium sp. B294B1A1]MCA0038896.1 FkbM family methyltransferase [Mesorhizobium sp. B292B1B]TPM45741.1 FkbM family methyltransferase [Mesorhizobium sp. B2-3-2]
MITSYAQNFEDVILWRALKSVERGFYIDIGAQDPVEHSVSLSFYEQGWRGVHVEPTPHYANKLRAARPDEEVIETAIGLETGLLTFHEFPGTGLSTGDPVIAKQHAEAGFEVKEISVPLVSLQDLLNRNAERDVHWLKIDVEGMESAVIESWGSSPVRPWIVVVESTKPLTKEESYDEWDPHLKELGYEFVYFDGLNRFYISETHPELKNSFGPGPNYFDEFVLPVSSKSNMLSPIRQELDAREDEIVRLQQQLADMDDVTARQLADGQAAIEERDAEIARLASIAVENGETIANLKYELRVEKSRTHDWWLKSEAQQRQIEEIYRSTSWKLMGPYRRIGRMSKRVFSATHLGRLKTKRDYLAIRVIRFIMQRPQLRAFLAKQLRRYPPLFNRFRDFAIAKIISDNRLPGTSPGFLKYSKPYFHSTGPTPDINPRILRSSVANRIFLDLEQALKRRKKV